VDDKRENIRLIVKPVQEKEEAMNKLHRYKKKPGQYLVAVQLDLDTDGFVYRKWKGVQKCKKGDWLVNNCGDIYTIDRRVFEKTYKKVGDGRYVKVTPVWAEVATEAGTVRTKEGESAYVPGDYVVYNNPDKTDGYRIRPEKFESMYELDE
jgi:hypothetical protein